MQSVFVLMFCQCIFFLVIVEVIVMELVNFFQSSSYFSAPTKFRVLVIGVFIWILATTLFKSDNSVVQAILIFAVIIFALNLYVTKQTNKLEDDNAMTLYNLNVLQQKMYEYVAFRVKTELKGTNVNKSIVMQMRARSKLDSMYMDATLIHFLHSVSYLWDYNPKLFFSLLKGVNNLLKIKESIYTLYESSGVYPDNCHELFEQAEILMANCMNYMHAFVYTLPKATVSYKQHGAILKRLQELLKANVMSIADACDHKREMNGVNTRTKYIHRYPAPKPLEEKRNQTIFEYYN
jgi:hypothetical protein